MKLDQRVLELLRFIQPDGEFVGLILVFPGLLVHQKLDDRVERFEHHLEQHKADDDGLRRGGTVRTSHGQGGGEVERGEEAAVVDEDVEEGEGEQEVELGYEQELGRVGYGGQRAAHRSARIHTTAAPYHRESIPPLRPLTPNTPFKPATPLKQLEPLQAFDSKPLTEVPMPKLMRQHRLNLGRGALLHERIVYHNVLAPRETVKVSERGGVSETGRSLARPDIRDIHDDAMSAKWESWESWTYAFECELRLLPSIT
jgi:hypothetical protein